MHRCVERILITEEELIKRIRELGQVITEEYKEDAPLLVGLLKGSVPFLSELIKHIDLDIEYDFMDVSSYSGTESTGEIRVVKDLDCSVRGAKILIVEDIVDTGRTLKTVKELLYSKGAESVKVITLLDKPDRRVVELESDYVGFVIPNEFVIGYGLDFDQKYRNLPYVGVLKEECYK